MVLDYPIAGAGTATPDPVKRELPSILKYAKAPLQAWGASQLKKISVDMPSLDEVLYLYSGSQTAVLYGQLDNPRELAREKLLAAGYLVTSIKAPLEIPELTDDEILELGRLPLGVLSLSDTIDEDRGKY